jgi:pimeloyl-ACP methyl ester carboxylesterase
MSIERFADDVADLVDRVAGGGPVDVWGFSLGALTATSRAVRHPGSVRRPVLAAGNVRMDGYHPEIIAPEQDDPRLPTQAEFASSPDRAGGCNHRRPVSDSHREHVLPAINRGFSAPATGRPPGRHGPATWRCVR